MSEAKNRTCENCAYWVKRPRFMFPDNGNCYRYPPQLLGDTGYFRFPVTTASDWCGEFSPRAPPV
jgi:hypothetical protein